MTVCIQIQLSLNYLFSLCLFKDIKIVFFFIALIMYILINIVNKTMQRFEKFEFK